MNQGQDFKMDSMLAQDVTQSQKLKKPEFEGVPWDDFMTHIRASLGMSGFSYLDQSREPELLAKIKELEAEKTETEKKYAETLELITKEIESLKSDK